MAGDLHHDAELPDKIERQIGLLAHGSAGAWQVEIDEANSGEPRWFMQIDGPARYLYFRIEHPRIIDSILCFVGGFNESGAAFFCPSGTAGQATELSLSDFGGSAVVLLRDEGGNDCTLLITGPDDLGVRINLTESDSDLVALVGALREVRSELDEAGALATASANAKKRED